MTVIDAGLITSLKPDVANPFGDFLRALCASDVDTIVEKILEFNVGKQEVDEAAFRAKVKEITDHFKAQDKSGDGAKLQRRQTQGAGPHGAREERYALGDVVGEILLNLQRFKIVLRGVRWVVGVLWTGGLWVCVDACIAPYHITTPCVQDVAASIMTISVSEGLILQLDPDFDMVRSGAS